jgi:transketolase
VPRAWRMSFLTAYAIAPGNLPIQDSRHVLWAYARFCVNKRFVKRELTSHLLLSAKLRLLRMHYEAGVGHIGGNLSSIDILMCLYHQTLGPDDAFVLSKGHAAGALYVTLWSRGELTDDDLVTFHRDGTRLSGHPPCSGIPGILFATGSLGHGQSLAAGLALAKQLKAEPGRVFCLTSDGEWNEGSSWEALIFAKHHTLSNLTLIVDLNGLQGFGTTKDVADLGSLAEKFRTFGWYVLEVEGHDATALQLAFAECAVASTPSVIVARTTKGNGVSFMEGRMDSHYLPMDRTQYDQAVHEVQLVTTRQKGRGE